VQFVHRTLLLELHLAVQEENTRKEKEYEQKYLDAKEFVRRVTFPAEEYGKVDDETVWECMKASGVSPQMIEEQIQDILKDRGVAKPEPKEVTRAMVKQ